MTEEIAPYNVNVKGKADVFSKTMELKFGEYKHEKDVPLTEACGFDAGSDDVIHDFISVMVCQLGRKSLLTEFFMDAIEACSPRLIGLVLVLTIKRDIFDRFSMIQMIALSPPPDSKRGFNHKTLCLRAAFNIHDTTLEQMNNEKVTFYEKLAEVQATKIESLQAELVEKFIESGLPLIVKAFVLAHIVSDAFDMWSKGLHIRSMSNNLLMAQPSGRA